MPQHGNVKSEFIQKDIFYIKPVISSYILVCSKTFLRLGIK